MNLKKSNEELVEMKNDTIFLNDVNTVEVIDELGRSYIKFRENSKVELSFKNNGKTLKILLLKKLL
jgi:C4-type Zn-finger protein